MVSDVKLSACVCQRNIGRMLVPETVPMLNSVVQVKFIQEPDDTPVPVVSHRGSSKHALDGQVDKIASISTYDDNNN